MKTVMTVAASLLVLTTLATPSFAGIVFNDYTPIEINDNTPVDVNDYTPIQINDNTPVNVNDYTPIEVTGPINPSDEVDDALIDAVLDGEGAVVTDGSSTASGGRYYIGCTVVSGGDVLFANTGDRTLPAATRLKWNVSQASDSGYVELGQTLVAGETLRLDDATSASTGAACVARILNL